MTVKTIAIQTVFELNDGYKEKSNGANLVALITRRKCGGTVFCHFFLRVVVFSLMVRM